MTTKLTVLATGGTIAGIAGSAITPGYRSGEIGIEDYLEKVGGLGLEAELSGKQIANIDSADIGPMVWTPLHQAAQAALADPAAFRANLAEAVAQFTQDLAGVSDVLGQSSQRRREERQRAAREARANRPWNQR